MALLIIYVLIALGFSFLCSIAEAVILCISPAHIALLRQQGRPSAELLHRLKKEINNPLAAILTLNTIAHTVGAAGAGAQAAKVFGSASLGVTSAILTLLILIFSEIIPKTLGAHYWRQLAVPTAYGLRVLIWALYPFVKLSELLTRGIAGGPTLRGVNRSELLAIAELGHREGELAVRESTMLRNLLRLRETPVKAAMTPRTVVFALPGQLSVGEYFTHYEHRPFSRIPIFEGQFENVTGFVLRSDLLLAQARGQTDLPIADFRRDIRKIPESMDLSTAFDLFLHLRTHLMLIIDEYGGLSGVLTLEDALETLLGLEIMDESDRTEDMQVLARRLWKKRAKELGLDVGED